MAVIIAGHQRMAGKKILLLRPPLVYRRGSIQPSINIPLGLLYIAAILEKENFSVDILDGALSPKRPFIFNRDGSVHAGLAWPEFEQQIKKNCPDLVGITAPFSTQYDPVMATAAIVKKVNPQAKIVVGGNYPTARPQDFLESGRIDIVCLGEGECTMLEIACNFYAGEGMNTIDGTAVKNGEKVFINKPRAYIKDLDQLPFPAYHKINLVDYFTLNKNYIDVHMAAPILGHTEIIHMITSRGCPFDCIFCSIHLHMGKAWRAHSPEYVLRHIDFLVKNYKVKHIHFEDDNLVYDVQRFGKVLDGLIVRDNPVVWDTPNGVRLDFFTPELVQKCSASGCGYLMFAVESASMRVQKEVIKKNIDPQKALELLGLCRAAKLDTHLCFVVGFPGETPDEIEATLDFALRAERKYDAMSHIMIATPLPGTKLEEDFIKNKLIKEPLRADFLMRMTQGGALLDGGTFSARWLKGRLRRNSWRHYLWLGRSSMGVFLRNPKLVGLALRKIWQIKTRRVLLFYHIYVNKNIILRFIRRGLQPNGKRI